MENSFEKPKNRKIELLTDLQLEKVDSPTLADLTIMADEKKPEEIKKKLAGVIQEKYWWFGKEMAEKDEIIEQMKFENINIYNFFRPLKIDEKNKIKDGLEFLKNIKPELLSTFENIIIRGTDGYNNQANNNLLGYSFSEARSINMYPETFSESRERRIPEISNLELITVHEPTHHIIKNNVDMLNQWKKDFNWCDNDDSEIRLEDGVTKKREIAEQPERCITDYAQVNATEDICESMAALYAGTSRLDDEKKKFIMKKYFNKNESDLIGKISNVPIDLPKLGVVKYFVQKPKKFKIKN